MSSALSAQPKVTQTSLPTKAHDEQHAPAHRVSGSVVAGALLVACAYAAGAWIGFALTFPPTTPSVLWPPNSILTVVFLVSPVARWWVYLLAVLPAHVLIEWNAGLPLALVGPLFVTNCSEAVLAAAGVRLFSDAPTRFDTLRRVAVFIGAAAFFAPFVSSFLDAAVVTLVREEPYWLVWRTRFFSNALTALTLVPAAVTLLTSGFTWMQATPPARRGEAALFALGLLVVTGVFTGALGTTPGIPQLQATPVVYLLPFLLWAAVRFGPGGASLSLLTITVMLIGAGMYGRGPFSDLEPAESVTTLQVFMIGVGIPCLALAAVVAERRRAEAALAEQLSFERTLARLSAAFVRMPCDGVEGRFHTWLGVTGDLLEVDGVALCALSADEQRIVNQYRWRRRNDASAQEVVAPDAAADFVRQLRARAPFVYAPGSRSFMIVPLLVRTRLFGGLAFATAAEEVAHSQQVQRLTVVAEVFATALARNEAEIEAQRSRQELAHFARTSTMGELTASLAHELNQPLAGILANSQTAERLAAAALPRGHDLREALSEIMEDTRRASDVIRRVRELARKSAPKVVALDINALVYDVTRLLRSDAIIRNVTVALDLHPDPLVVQGDHVQLRQVVLNLLVNAFDAVGEASDDARTVRLRTEAHRGGSCSPLGAGRGVRAGGGNRRADLRAVLQYEARRHGYGLVDRPFHRRGTWRHHLGTDRSERPRYHVPPYAAAGARRNGVTDHDVQATVIVVDDDPSIRRALRRALTAVGYAVRLFTSADEFVAAGPVQRPACLVLDVRMPGKTGFDLWETLVARGTDLPVIFISGHDDPTSELKAAKVGAVRFLAKPFDIEALLEAVEQAIYLDVTRGTDTREGSK